MLRRCLPALAMLFAIVAVPGRAQIVEDFESYASTPDLQTVWLYGELDTTTPNPGIGSQSLRRSGTAMYQSGYYSAISGGKAVDLSAEDLGVQGRRDPGSVSPTGLQVEIRDGSNLGCFSPMLEVTDTEWHAVDLDPQSESCLSSGIDLTDVSLVRLWVFNRQNAGGEFAIAANFDDVTVFLARGDFESGDFAGWDVVEPAP